MFATVASNEELGRPADMGLLQQLRRYGWLLTHDQRLEVTMLVRSGVKDHRKAQLSIDGGGARCEARDAVQRLF